MSRSRSVILFLPLSCPGERRYEVDHDDDDDEIKISEHSQ